MIVLSATATEVMLKFSSDITFVEYAMDLIRSVATYQGVAEPSRILLVSNELLRNAVVHGNRNDRGKLVTYRLQRLDDRRCRVEVEDLGDGFDIRSAAGLQGSATEQGTQCGRGYGAIAQMSDAVEFNAKGNRVTVYLEA